MRSHLVDDPRHLVEAWLLMVTVTLVIQLRFVKMTVGLRKREGIRQVSKLQKLFVMRVGSFCGAEGTLIF